MNKVQRAHAGCVYFDAACPCCARVVRGSQALFQSRGFHFLPLADLEPASACGLSPDDLQREIKLLTPDRQWRGGSDAVAYLLRSVWWLWPVGALLSLPGFRSVGAWAYRWVAAHRYAWGWLTPGGPVHEGTMNLSSGAGRAGLGGRHSAFFVMP